MSLTPFELDFYKDIMFTDEQLDSLDYNNSDINQLSLNDLFPRNKNISLLKDCNKGTMYTEYKLIFFSYVREKIISDDIWLSLGHKMANVILNIIKEMIHDKYYIVLLLGTCSCSLDITREIIIKNSYVYTDYNEAEEKYIYLEKYID
jgi:hypothetical protein